MQRQSPPTADELDPEVARTSRSQNIARLKICEYSCRPVFQSNGGGQPTAEELDPEVACTSQPQNTAKSKNGEYSGCLISAATAEATNRRRARPHSTRTSLPPKIAQVKTCEDPGRAGTARDVHTEVLQCVGLESIHRRETRPGGSSHEPLQNIAKMKNCEFSGLPACDHSGRGTLSSPTADDLGLDAAIPRLVPPTCAPDSCSRLVSPICAPYLHPRCVHPLVFPNSVSGLRWARRTRGPPSPRCLCPRLVQPTRAPPDWCPRLSGVRAASHEVGWTGLPPSPRPPP